MDNLQVRRIATITAVVGVPLVAHALGAGVFAFCIAIGAIAGLFKNWDRLNA